MSTLPQMSLLVYTRAMYLGVDIGGTKTLAAVLDEHGVIQQKTKFPTNHDYPTFLKELRKVVADFDVKDFQAAGFGMPVTNFDRKRGIGIDFGNLPWQLVPAQDDFEKIAGCPVALENDAKLAGLSEAMLLKKYSKVLYVTVSTGIGTALIVDRRIDPYVGDGGGAMLMFTHHGKLQPWEHFASGKAIVERFGKRAEDIHDTATWQAIVHDLSRGFLELIAVMDPDVIVIGGSVGTFFDRYKDLLNAELKKYETPLMPIPPIVQAQRPEEAVVFGCYDYAKQLFGGKHA
jgi:predicted NBD/HSP70 family sugar kinase